MYNYEQMQQAENGEKAMRKILDEKEVITMNNITLAFLGDAVYSLFMREQFSVRCDAKPYVLTEACSEAVSAKEQAKKIDMMIADGFLTETELGVYKRARNAKKANKAKGATVTDYHKSTGFEALLGYLYLTGRDDRLSEILNYKINYGDYIKTNENRR